MKIGITGGIGSGKSYVCRLLEQRGISVYDCDAAAKRLIRTSPIIYKELCQLIGPQAYLNNDATGEHILNKSVVTQYLLQSADHAHAIDRIVHPAVFRDFEESGIEWMESAILYESGIYRLVDKAILVSAPDEVRIQRIINRDHITREKAMQWMERQWPQEEIRQRADYEIVNDGIMPLEPQLKAIFKQLASLKKASGMRDENERHAQ